MQNTQTGAMNMLDFFGLFNVATLYIILGLTVLVIALVVLYIVNIVKIKKLNGRIYSISVCIAELTKGKDGKSLEEIMTTRFGEIDKLKASNAKHTKQINAINEELLSVYKKVGIVKYDAFNEMGGKLSFALAMLDKSNNGYVINAMHSREGCYTYIKEIVKGESYIALGDEEKKALERAINCDSLVTD